MWLLTFAVILFIIVVGMIIYANWPASASGQSCGGCGGCQGCQQNPCNRCGMPKRRCGCPPAGGCPFC